MKAAFSIKAIPGGLRTDGLQGRGYSDFRIQGISKKEESAARDMLQILGDYQIDGNVKIRDGESVTHGSWLLEMRSAGDILDIWERSPKNGAVPGASFTLSLWSKQQNVCDRMRAGFQPARYGDLVSISGGVLEGELPLEGIRYPMQRQMSGWILTTDRYTDISSLRTEHVYHLAISPVDVVKYLALPAGFHFRITSAGESIGFDEAVARGE